MPMMGYGKWQAFEVPIARAMCSAENQNMDLTSNFTRSRKFSGTKPADDYELSRFAEYLVAMNGDPNKPEVAQIAKAEREVKAGRKRCQLNTSKYVEKLQT